MRAHSFAIPLFALVFTIPPAAVAAESGANPSLGEDPNPVQHLSLGPFDDEEDMVFRKPHPNMGKNYSVEEFHKLAEGINDFIRAEVDKVEAYRLEAERTRQELWKVSVPYSTPLLRHPALCRPSRRTGIAWTRSVRSHLPTSTGSWAWPWQPAFSQRPFSATRCAGGERSKAIKAPARWSTWLERNGDGEAMKPKFVNSTP
jgi:hypothetical protein